MEREDPEKKTQRMMHRRRRDRGDDPRYFTKGGFYNESILLRMICKGNFVGRKLEIQMKMLHENEAM